MEVAKGKGKLPTICAYVVVVYSGTVWARREEGRRMVDYLPHMTYLYMAATHWTGGWPGLDGVTWTV